jgi:hypothetical protein
MGEGGLWWYDVTVGDVVAEDVVLDVSASWVGDNRFVAEDGRDFVSEDDGSS